MAAMLGKLHEDKPHRAVIDALGREELARARAVIDGLFGGVPTSAWIANKLKGKRPA
jgi:hypothetical protein